MFDCLKKLLPKKNLSLFEKFISPYLKIQERLPPLESGSNRKIEFDLENQVRSLIYYHLFEVSSGRELLQTINDDPVSKKMMGVDKTVGRSTFFEAINTRGLPQMLEVFQQLYPIASKQLPKTLRHLGSLVSIDGSLIDATLSMVWADFRKNDRKARIHMGYDVNLGVPKKFVLTHGKEDEKKFVPDLIEPGETGIMDRYYQCYHMFDQWTDSDLKYVCRIKKNHKKTIIKDQLESTQDGVFFDSVVKLGTENSNETRHELRIVGYEADGKTYWIATNRFDLTAQDIAHIYKLRWSVESFFKWWKQNLAVYHVLARSEHGFSVQIVAGLITYLLMAIYCQQNYQQHVSIQNVRQIRIEIRNDFIRQESSLGNLARRALSRWPPQAKT